MGKKKINSSENRLNVHLVLFIIVIFLLLWNFAIIGISLGLTGAASTGQASLSICSDVLLTIETIADQEINHTAGYIYRVNASGGTGSSDYSFETNISFIDVVNITANSSLIYFTPNISIVGEYHVNVSVFDEGGSCRKYANESFNLTINNSAPVFSGTIGIQIWNEDTSNTDIDLSDYFSDDDSDTLYYGIEGAVNISASFVDGAMTLTPDTNWYGSETVNFTANDTINLTRSNEVLLVVVETAAFCGDLVCDAGETCSTCSGDCGACAASGGSSGGGGGGSGGSSSGGGTSDTGSSDSSDSSESSSEDSDSSEDSSSEESSSSEDADDVDECEPSWICTEWEPSNCDESETQTRYCVDSNNCDEESPETERECETGEESFYSTAKEWLDELFGESGATGLALSFGGEEIATGPLILMVLFVIGLLSSLAFIKYRSKGRKKKSHVLLRDKFLYIPFEGEDYSIVSIVSVSLDLKGNISIKYDFVRHKEIEGHPPCLDHEHLDVEVLR